MTASSGSSKLRVAMLYNQPVLAAGHRDWFNGDSVHLNGAGGRQLGRFLAAALDDHFATADGG